MCGICLGYAGQTSHIRPGGDFFPFPLIYFCYGAGDLLCVLPAALHKGFYATQPSPFALPHQQQVKLITLVVVGGVG